MYKHILVESHTSDLLFCFVDAVLYLALFWSLKTHRRDLCKRYILGIHFGAILFPGLSPYYLEPCLLSCSGSGSSLVWITQCIKYQQSIVIVGFKKKAIVKEFLTWPWSWSWFWKVLWTRAPVSFGLLIPGSCQLNCSRQFNQWVINARIIIQIATSLTHTQYDYTYFIFKIIFSLVVFVFHQNCK